MITLRNFMTISEYDIKVVTGQYPCSGTDSRVFITLYGELTRLLSTAGADLPQGTSLPVILPYVAYAPFKSIGEGD